MQGESCNSHFGRSIVFLVGVTNDILWNGARGALLAKGLSGDPTLVRGKMGRPGVLGLCLGGVGGGGESMLGELTYWFGITGGMWMGEGMFGGLSSAASPSASL